MTSTNEVLQEAAQGRTLVLIGAMQSPSQIGEANSP